MDFIITNRTLCLDNFEKRIEYFAKTKEHSIILREKDLSCEEYEILAKKLINLCAPNQSKLILHTHIKVAQKLNIKKIHLPYPIFLKEKDSLNNFEEIGVSVHSLEEAQIASKQGATYLIAGHIFPTNCKKDLPPRGLSFLTDICQAVSLPVYAIGGITEENYQDIKKAGATGACYMSSYMIMPIPI